MISESKLYSCQCTSRLCRDSNVNFGMEHIDRFNVQNSGCPGILNAEASNLH